MTTKKEQKILLALQSDKSFQKSLNKVNYYSTESFVNDAARYLKAIKERRVINSIGSVSSSGMSRTIKFLAPEYNKSRKEFQYLNFYCFFKCLGFTPARGRDDYFSIGGCGMDMIFHTNYTIIHKLYHFGFINKEECDKLAQMPPTTI